jgi:hypothetical protein
VAASGALALMTIDPVGTVCVIWMEIGATMVTLAVAVTAPAPLAAVEVAVIVTTGLVVPKEVGTVGGAVNVAGAPLAVCKGVTVPQGAASQLTLQVTPELVVSSETTAMTVAVALVSMLLGGDWVRLIEMEAVTVNEAIALKLWSAVAKAVMVIVEPTMSGI